MGRIELQWSLFFSEMDRQWFFGLYSYHNDRPFSWMEILNPLCNLMIT